jgi:hypothetical protein
MTCAETGNVFNLEVLAAKQVGTQKVNCGGVGFHARTTTSVEQAISSAVVRVNGVIY